MTTSRRTTFEPSTLDQSRAALADVERQIDILNAQHLAASQDLGDALAASRLGNKKAEGEAGRCSMRRAGIEADRDRLRLEATSLKARIAQHQADAEARKGGQAVAQFEQVTADVRALERQFASLMREALRVGKQLQEKDRTWGRARAAVSPHADVTGIIAPRLPAALVRPDGLEDPDTTVDRWLAEPVRRGPEQPPRLLTDRDVLQVRTADAESLTIVERIHAKIDQKIGA